MATAQSLHRDNVLIGSGRVFLDVRDADGNLTGERYLGDAVGATLNVESERATVFSGSGPVARQLVDKLRQQTRSMQVTLHDMSMENLALFLAAGDPKAAADAAQAVADEVIGPVTPGRWYQLGASDAKPAGVLAVTAIGAVTMGDKAAQATATTKGTDYEVDADRARLYVTPGAGIAAGKYLKVASYTPKAAAARQQVLATELREARAALRYLEDTQTGKGRNYYAPLCSVSAGGEMALMSRDTEQQIVLDARILDPGAGKPSLVCDGVPA